MSMQIKLKKSLVIASIVLAGIPEGQSQSETDSTPVETQLIHISPSNPIAEILFAAIEQNTASDSVLINDLTSEGKILIKCIEKTTWGRSGDPFPIFQGCKVKLVKGEITGVTEWTTIELLSHTASAVID